MAPPRRGFLPPRPASHVLPDYHHWHACHSASLWRCKRAVAFWTQWLTWFPSWRVGARRRRLFYGVTSGGWQHGLSGQRCWRDAIVTRLEHRAVCAPFAFPGTDTRARTKRRGYMLDTTLRLLRLHPLLPPSTPPRPRKRAAAGAVPAGGIVQPRTVRCSAPPFKWPWAVKSVLSIGGGTTTMTTITAFHSNGYNPTGTLKLGPGGMLYGTTSHGGPNIAEWRGASEDVAPCSASRRGRATVEHLAFSTIQQPLFAMCEITSGGTIWAAGCGAPAKAMSLAGAELPMSSLFSRTCAARSKRWQPVRICRGDVSDRVNPEQAGTGAG